VRLALERRNAVALALVYDEVVDVSAKQDQLAASRGSPIRPSDKHETDLRDAEALVRRDTRHPGASASITELRSPELRDFAALIRRGADIAAQVDDNRVHAELIRLEAILATASFPQDTYAQLERLLEALSR